MKMSRFHVSPLYNPVNPETYVTEKKVEVKFESRSDENLREVQSEKLQANVDGNVWKSNQSFGPYPHLPWTPFPLIYLFANLPNSSQNRIESIIE